MDWRPPGFSVLRISQTKILDWVAMSSSRGSSQLRDQTHVTAWAVRFFTTEPPEKPHNTCVWCIGYMYTYICLFSTLLFHGLICPFWCQYHTFLLLPFYRLPYYLGGKFFIAILLLKHDFAFGVHFFSITVPPITAFLAGVHCSLDPP